MAKYKAELMKQYEEKSTEFSLASFGQQSQSEISFGRKRQKTSA